MSSQPTVHLLALKDCPLAAQARENLKAALGRYGEPLLWQELDLLDTRTPERWRSFPSPTVLVDGLDVQSGEASADGKPACRREAPPSADAILEKINASPYGPFRGMLNKVKGLMGRREEGTEPA